MSPPAQLQLPELQPAVVQRTETQPVELDPAQLEPPEWSWPSAPPPEAARASRSSPGGLATASLRAAKAAKGCAGKIAAKLFESSDGAPAPLTELRMVPVAAAAWATAAAVIRLPAPAGLVTAGVGAVVMALLIAALFARSGCTIRTAAAACLAPLAVVVLVAAAAGTTVLHRNSGPVQEAITGEAVISGDFRALGDARAGTPDRFTGKQRYLVEAQLLSFTRDGKRSTASTPVLVIGSIDFAQLRLGDTFSTAGALSATGPGDRSAALLRAGRSPTVSSAVGLYGMATDLRGNFSERSKDLGHADAAGLLPGMVLGDRTPLPYDLAAAMKDTGLTHLTAVSGANCSYLLAFVFLLARLLRLPRFWAAAAGLAVLAAFVLVVRPDASVLRAAVMGSIGTAAVLTGRGKVPAALLCLCVTILLAIDPWLSGSYAFILSVCATAGLITLGPRFAAALERGLPRPLAVLTAVPLAAQITCAPVLILLQPQVPMYSLPANIAAAPVVPLVTIVGMAAVVLASLLPALAFLPLMVAGAGAGWVAAIARFFADAPGALLPWTSGVTGAVLMAAASASLAGGLLFLGRNPMPADSRQPPEPQRSQRETLARAPAGARARTTRWLAGAAVLLLAAAATLWWRPGPAPVAGDWIAAACDVGQGDALVIRTGTAAAVVVDTGREPPALDACLDSLRIRTVDLLVISHVHADHYGGAAAAGEGREVRALAYSSAETGLPAEIEELSSGYGLEAQRMVRGMTGAAGAVQWRVLWPPGPEAPANSAAVAQDPLAENDASAVLLVSVAGVSLLFTGDIEEGAAARLLQADPSLRGTRIDVLKVAHHGARNGGSALITALRPRLALISVGAENTYGHPSAQTLANLESLGALVARTDQLGTFTLRLDGTRLIVDRVPG